MKAESYEWKGTLNIPKDVVYGVPIVMLTGDFEMIIENYQGIIEYTADIIKIRVKHGVIKVEGKELEVSYYKNKDMKIVGEIKRIEYL